MKIKYDGSKALLVTAGSVIYGISLGLVLSPSVIVPGGLGGVAIMITQFVPVGVGTITLLLNIPLMIAGGKKFGRRFLALTVYAIVVSSVIADICTAVLPPLTQSRLLAAVSGGALMGGGIGLVFRGGATTGGSEIVAKLVRRKRPHLKLSTLVFAVDGVISIGSGVVFKDADTALYSLIALFAFSKTMDWILCGGDSAGLVFVITHNGDKVRKSLLTEANVGCTVINAAGGYSGEDMQVIICGSRKQRLPVVREKIFAADENAFLLITGANEIFGLGFKNKNSETF